MHELIVHIEKSLEDANNYKSKLPNEIMFMKGMSGRKTRHFYNNLCSMEDARYLEIGSWFCSTICSAMYNNSITCVTIDNWSEFNNNTKNEFLVNFNKYKGCNNAFFIEKNCWDIDIVTLRSLHKFNIYMYDGNHSETSHYSALNHFLSCLDEVFIYLVDDWNWESVRSGTMQSIIDTKCEILYKNEIRTTNDNSHAKPAFHDSDWHNGISIFVLKQK